MMSIHRSFENLKWDDLRQKHQGRWDLLRSRYHLEPEQIHPCASLDHLAWKCVHQCREYLFTSAWQQQVPGAELSEGWRSMTGIIPADYLEDLLTPALCDHLIMTFAHRFYCDNLEPHRSIYADEQVLHECLKELSRYYIPDISVKKKLSTVREEFCDNKVTIFHKHQEGIKKCIHDYFAMPFEDVEDTAQQERETVDSVFADMFAPPNWLFSIAMDNNWTNNPFSTKERINGGENDLFVFSRDWDEKKSQPKHFLLKNLTQFFAENELCRFLLKWETDSTPCKQSSKMGQISPQSIPVLGSAFATKYTSGKS